MAHKSKTQRAKASAARAARKVERDQEQVAKSSAEPSTDAEETSGKAKKALFSRASKEASSEEKQLKTKKEEKQIEKSAKKRSRFAFIKEVRAELKRVTWPTRQDVVQWSLVVVAALLFFGIFVGLLDNVVITPLLVAVSGLGA